MLGLVYQCSIGDQSTSSPSTRQPSLARAKLPFSIRSGNGRSGLVTGQRPGKPAERPHSCLTTDSNQHIAAIRGTFRAGTEKQAVRIPSSGGCKKKARGKLTFAESICIPGSGQEAVLHRAIRNHWRCSRPTEAGTLPFRRGSCRHRTRSRGWLEAPSLLPAWIEDLSDRRRQVFDNVEERLDTAE